MWSIKILLIQALALLVFSFSIAVASPPSGYGQVSVKKWADDRKSAFTFTFDDGFSCDYDYIMPVLDSFGFKGTFFVITSVVTDDTPGIWRYGTWKEFQGMSLDGHEIASHTVTHPDHLSVRYG